jgi:hypothetical protein
MSPLVVDTAIIKCVEKKSKREAFPPNLSALAMLNGLHASL